MSSPIRLTDAELDAVFAAAEPIAVDRRDAFLRHIANALQGSTDPGPGEVYRAILAAQRAHCAYPDLSGVHYATKYSRVLKRARG